MTPRRLALLLFVSSSLLHPITEEARAQDAQPTRQVRLVFSGGHETELADHGRPVVLIAAALGVPPKVFREAFSHVRPAPAGEQPDPHQVQLNKRALLDALRAYGVTNDRLDEVSNYYRYHPESGEMWPHTDAAGYALVRNGKIVSIVLANPGAGYTNAPKVSTPGVALAVYPMAVLSFGTDLSKNGSVAKIDLMPVGDSEGVSVPKNINSQEQIFFNPQPVAPPQFYHRHGLLHLLLRAEEFKWEFLVILNTRV